MHPALASEITLEVDTWADSNDPAFRECTSQPDDCSLRGAITRANLDAPSLYVIQLPAGVYRLALEGAQEDGNANGDLDIYGRITLQGKNAEDTFLDGNQIDRVLDIHSGARVELQDITIQGGQAPHGATTGAAGEHGGGIFNLGELILRHSVVRGNQAGDGAAGHLTDGMEIHGGDAGSGGGIYNLGLTTIINSIILNNLAGKGGDSGDFECHSDPPWSCFGWTHPGDGGNGGGILNRGVLNIESSEIMSNTVGQPGAPGSCYGFDCPIDPPEWIYGLSGMGGGILNQGLVELADSTLVGNEGWGAGGGLNNQGTAVLEGCTVEGNSGESGGGIYNNSDLLVKESWIRDNDGAMGGGIYNDGTAIVEDTQIVHNSTREGEPGSDVYLSRYGCFYLIPPGHPNGGGVYNTGRMTVDHSQINFNSTGDGGRGGKLTYWCCDGNIGPAAGEAGGYGGGIYNSGSLELNLSTVEGNNTGDGGMGGENECGGDDGSQGSGGSGGGVYNWGAMWINLGTLQGNQTGNGLSGGLGGAIANEGKLTLSGSTIHDNRTAPGGDGGGIFASSPITISAAIVISNTASGMGGGFAFNGINSRVMNSIVGKNKGEDLGSGLYATGSMLDLENNTFAQNYGGDGSGLHIISSTLHLTDTILVSHTLGLMVNENSIVELESTLWGSGAWANQLDWAGGGTVITGTHNYWAEPGFVDPNGLDYHLTGTSFAIDRGMNNGLGADIDFQPRPNPASQLVDLGADEYWIADPIETVSVTGPPTVTRTTPITLTATISPSSATPNIIYYWRPPPVEGQWTDNALYAWQLSGVEKVTIMAINATSAVSETVTITVEPVYSLVYLPVIRQ